MRFGHSKPALRPRETRAWQLPKIAIPRLSRFQNLDFRFFRFLIFFWKKNQKSDIKNHEISKNLISNPVKSLYFAIELEKQLSIALTELFWDLLDFEIQTDIWKSQVLCAVLLTFFPSGKKPIPPGPRIGSQSRTRPSASSIDSQSPYSAFGLESWLAWSAPIFSQYQFAGH